MARALVLLADGFEEIEAITIIDVLRRGGIDVTTAALANRSVKGAHDITVMADTMIDVLEYQIADAIVLPGGGPGAERLRGDERARYYVQKHAEQDKIVAAICAAPTVLEAAELLAGKRATCYPGYTLPSATQVEETVVEDGNIITSRGPGTAMEFALALVARLVGHDVASSLRRAMLI